MATSDVAVAPLPGGLYLLATPIGAADDLTLRGLDALRRADALACEDSRRLRRLLSIHGVPLGGRPIIVYHDHNAETARPKILARLRAGESVVYASDAGTPLVADPGFKLVEAAREIGAPATALPGPSALLAALCLAGLPTDKFCFLGFPPPKTGPRRRFFEAWRETPATLVLFEAPHRLADTLVDLAAVMGPRPAAIARELTKRYEEVRRGDLETLAEGVRTDPPKGEIVLIIGPPDAPPPPREETLDAALREALATMTVKDAARTISEQFGIPRKLVYDRAIRIRDETANDLPSEDLPSDHDAASDDDARSEREPSGDR